MQEEDRKIDKLKTDKGAMKARVSPRERGRAQRSEFSTAVFAS
jgi:ribosomal protein L22